MTIDKAVFSAVLDCVEAVVAAATWVYKAIKIVIKDIILFLEFLFGWQDILVTHKVLKNLILCLSRHAIDGIETTKADAARLFQQLQREINSWGKIPDFGQQTAVKTLAANPPMARQNSAPANLGVHHFQGSVAASSSNLSSLNPIEVIFSPLITLLEAEGETLAAATNAIKRDIIDQFSSLSVTQVIKRFLEIVADTVLQSAENIVVTMLDVFAQLVKGMINVLTATIDIPILSWLYKELTGEDLSFLDLICLITAIPVTLIYKAAAGKTPFPSDDTFTRGLIGAKNMADIQALFVVPREAVRVASHAPMAFESAAAANSLGGAPRLDLAKLRSFGFFSGIASFFGGIVLILAIVARRNLGKAIEEKPKGMVMLATMEFVAYLIYVLPTIATFFNVRPTNWNWYASINNGLTLLSILKRFAWIGVQAYKEEKMAVGQLLEEVPPAGEIFAYFESLLGVFGNLPVIANLVMNEDVATTTYKSLIPETIGNFASILEFLIEWVKDPELKTDLQGAQIALMMSYGTFMMIAGGIYEFSPDQH